MDVETAAELIDMPALSPRHGGKREIAAEKVMETPGAYCDLVFNVMKMPVIKGREVTRQFNLEEA